MWFRDTGTHHDQFDRTKGSVWRKGKRKTSRSVDGFRFEAMTADVPGWRTTRVALRVAEKVDNSRGPWDTSASLRN